MIEPGLLASIRRRVTACATKKAARMFRPATASKSSSVASMNGPGRLVPALLTRISKGSAPATAVRTEATSVTSSAM